MLRPFPGISATLIGSWFIESFLQHFLLPTAMQWISAKLPKRKNSFCHNFLKCLINKSAADLTWIFRVLMSFVSIRNKNRPLDSSQSSFTTQCFLQLNNDYIFEMIDSCQESINVLLFFPFLFIHSPLMKASKKFHVSDIQFIKTILFMLLIHFFGRNAKSKQKMPWKFVLCGILDSVIPSHFTRVECVCWVSKKLCFYHLILHSTIPLRQNDK